MIESSEERAKVFILRIKFLTILEFNKYWLNSLLLLILNIFAKRSVSGRQ